MTIRARLFECLAQERERCFVRDGFGQWQEYDFTVTADVRARWRDRRDVIGITRFTALGVFDEFDVGHDGVDGVALNERGEPVHVFGIKSRGLIGERPGPFGPDEQVGPSGALVDSLPR